MRVLQKDEDNETHKYKYYNMTFQDLFDFNLFLISFSYKRIYINRYKIYEIIHKIKNIMTCIQE